MSGESGRIGRFVRVARGLLLMQVAAALIALALAIWAVVAVRDLAAERDRLRDELAAERSRQPELAAPSAPDQAPIGNEVRPPAIIPMAVPVMPAAPDTNVLLPGNLQIETGPPPPEAGPPAAGQEGADGNQGRARPGRWTRPPQVTPPARDTNQQRPPADNQE
jgi:hypothetical protein